MAFFDTLNSSRVFRLAEFTNEITNGMFWPFILLLIFLIFFTGLLNRGAGNAMLTATFIVSLMAMLLRWGNLVSDYVMWLPSVAFCITLGILIFQRR